MATRLHGAVKSRFYRTEVIDFHLTAIRMTTNMELDESSLDVGKYQNVEGVFGQGESSALAMPEEGGLTASDSLSERTKAAAALSGLVIVISRLVAPVMKLKKLQVTGFGMNFNEIVHILTERVCFILVQRFWNDGVMYTDTHIIEETLSQEMVKFHNEVSCRRGIVSFTQHGVSALFTQSNASSGENVA